MRHDNGRQPKVHRNIFKDIHAMTQNHTKIPKQQSFIHSFIQPFASEQVCMERERKKIKRFVEHT